MPLLQLFDQEDEKEYSFHVKDEVYSRVVEGEDLTLASILLEKEKEKQNFITAFNIMKASAAEASTSKEIVELPINSYSVSNQEKERVESGEEGDELSESIVSNQEVEQLTVQNGDIEEPENKMWYQNSTKMLIELCRKFDKEFESGVKKHVWKKIASEISKKFNKTYTYQQCDTKFKGLKKMYKTIKKHNSQSGNDTKTWTYFDLMDELMFDKPEIHPVATCSSAQGLVVNELQEKGTLACNTPLSSKGTGKENKLTTNIMRKRKLHENTAERRHQEKMSTQDRYLSLLERMTVAIENSSQNT